MVAVYNKAFDTRRSEFREGVLKPDLCLRSSDRTVVDITGDQQEIGLLSDAEVYEIIESLVSGGSDALADHFIARAQAPNGAIDVEICGVNESECWQGLAPVAFRRH